MGNSLNGMYFYFLIKLILVILFIEYYFYENKLKIKRLF